MLINPYLRSQALSIPRGTKKAAELCHDMHEATQPVTSGVTEPKILGVWQTNPYN